MYLGVQVYANNLSREFVCEYLGLKLANFCAIV